MLTTTTTTTNKIRNNNNNNNKVDAKPVKTKTSTNVHHNSTTKKKNIIKLGNPPNQTIPLRICGSSQVLQPRQFACCFVRLFCFCDERGYVLKSECI